MRQYEAMFIFDSSFASDFANVEREVGRLMERARARLVFCKLWDERKLAYQIKNSKRGAYVLTYFESDPSRISGIERDCRLSDSVLRVLITKADGVTREEMEQFVPSRPASRPTHRDDDDRSSSEDETESATDSAGDADEPGEAVEAVQAAAGANDEDEKPGD